MKNWNGLRLTEEMKWVVDAQKNDIGQGSPKAMKWAKGAQNNMSIGPMMMDCLN